MEANNEQFTTMELFAGAGGGILASRILGHTPLVAYEWDAYCCQVLRERTKDGWFPGMQVREGDIRMQDTSEWRGRISCINAGFPCTDISVAGNQAGIGEGTRSGLYREVLRISDDVRPEYIFLENVAAIVTGADGQWLRTIIGDLAERGFDAVWCCLSAAEIGAKHKRNRWWLLGYPKPGQQYGHVANTKGRKNGWHTRIREEQRQSVTERCGDRKRKGNELLGKYGCPNGEGEIESALGGLANDVSDHMVRWNSIEAQVGRVTDEAQNRADKLKALGNAQVPLQAAVAFSILWKMMEESRTR